jgi:hypothetical protein
MIVYWVPSPMFTPGHPAPLIALVHHRMVGTLKSTDSAFTSSAGRQASTNFSVGYGCGRAGHPLTDAHVHQYVRLGDQAWGNGNWDASGSWDDRYPTSYVNSRTISIEHHDNGGRTLGNGKGVVPEKVIAVSMELDALLLRGDVDEMRLAMIRFRDGQATAIARELREMPVDRHHIIDHHYIAGRLKPYCWRPWADDAIGFPRDRYIAALLVTPPNPEEIVKSYPVPAAPSIGDVAKGTWLYDNDALEPSANNIQIDPARSLPYLGQPSASARIVEYVKADGTHTGRAYFVKTAELTNIRPVPDATPYDQDDITAATKPLEFRIAAAKAALG